MSVKLQSALVPPSMTSAQRDAIPTGRRPKGSAIFNTTTNELEVNVGSDATPIWTIATQKGENAVIWKNGTFSIPSAAWYPLVFDSLVSNPAGFYTLSGNQIIVSQTGVYLFSLSMMIAATLAAGFHRLVGIGRVISGTPPTSPSVSGGIVLNAAFPTGGNGIRCNAQLIAQLAAGEYVVCFAFQDGGGAQSTVGSGPDAEGPQIRVARLGSGA